MHPEPSSSLGRGSIFWQSPKYACRTQVGPRHCSTQSTCCLPSYKARPPKELHHAKHAWLLCGSTAESRRLCAGVPSFLLHRIVISRSQGVRGRRALTPFHALHRIDSVPGAAESAAASGADLIDDGAQVDVREAAPAEQLLRVHPPYVLLIHHLVRLLQRRLSRCSGRRFGRDGCSSLRTHARGVESDPGARLS